jgi:hypothetical protein
MTDFEIALLALFMYVQGLLVGYIIWAPLTAFKQALLDGMTFRFIWKRHDTK